MKLDSNVAKPWNKNAHSHFIAFKQKFIDFIRKYGIFYQQSNCRILCINVFVYGCVMVIPDTFLYMSLEQDYHFSRTFNGMCTTISTLACLPCFWFELLI